MKSRRTGTGRKLEAIFNHIFFILSKIFRYFSRSISRENKAMLLSVFCHLLIFTFVVPRVELAPVENPEMKYEISLVERNEAEMTEHVKTSFENEKQAGEMKEALSNRSEAGKVKEARTPAIPSKKSAVKKTPRMKNLAREAGIAEKREIPLESVSTPKDTRRELIEQSISAESRKTRRPDILSSIPDDLLEKEKIPSPPATREIELAYSTTRNESRNIMADADTGLSFRESRKPVIEASVSSVSSSSAKNLTGKLRGAYPESGFSFEIVDGSSYTALPEFLGGPPAIEYPEWAAREGAEGRIVLLIDIGEKGNVKSVMTLQSPLTPGLAKEIERQAWFWKFKPLYRDGRPLTGTVKVVVDLELN